MIKTEIKKVNNYICDSETDNNLQKEYDGVVSQDILSDTARVHRKTYHRNQCNYEASQNCYRKDHINSLHNDEKIFQCNQCKYTSLNKSSLTIHTDVHNQEKRLKCSHCE